MFGEYPWGIDDAMLSQFYKRVDLSIITAATLIVLFVGYITVKEICEKAGVNRSTFYLHYENTTDLLQETTR